VGKLCVSMRLMDKCGDSVVEISYIIGYGESRGYDFRMFLKVDGGNCGVFENKKLKLCGEV
jgi:hypothetical protein